MKVFATRAAAIAMLWVVVAYAVLATSSLSFEGGGYWIDMEIGTDSGPVIASVRFHKPSDPKGIILPRSDWQVEAFDVQRRVLTLRHKGGTTGVAPFLLSARLQNAVLTMDGANIESSFRWGQ